MKESSQRHYKVTDLGYSLWLACIFTNVSEKISMGIEYWVLFSGHISALFSSHVSEHRNIHIKPKGNPLEFLLFFSFFPSGKAVNFLSLPPSRVLIKKVLGSKLAEIHSGNFHTIRIHWDALIDFLKRSISKYLV